MIKIYNWFLTFLLQTLFKNHSVIKDMGVQSAKDTLTLYPQKEPFLIVGDNKLGGSKVFLKMKKEEPVEFPKGTYSFN